MSRQRMASRLALTLVALLTFFCGWAAGCGNTEQPGRRKLARKRARRGERRKSLQGSVQVPGLPDGGKEIPSEREVQQQQRHIGRRSRPEAGQHTVIQGQRAWTVEHRQWQHFGQRHGQADELERSGRTGTPVGSAAQAGPLTRQLQRGLQEPCPTQFLPDTSPG